MKTFEFNDEEIMFLRHALLFSIENQDVYVLSLLDDPYPFSDSDVKKQKDELIRMKALFSRFSPDLSYDDFHNMLKGGAADEK